MKKILGLQALMELTSILPLTSLLLLSNNIFLIKHNPEVVIFDLSPPYDENWQFFKTMRDAKTMQGRGIVLTTTNKNRLDEVLGEDSHALEVVGKPKDLHQIDAAIKAETRRAGATRLAIV